MNVILLNIFALSLFLSPCNVYPNTISKTSKTLHIPKSMKISTQSIISPNSTQARNNHIKKKSFTSWGKIPEFTVEEFSPNNTLKKAKPEIEIKKSTNLKDKKRIQREQKNKILDENKLDNTYFSESKNFTKENIIKNSTRQIKQISNFIQKNTIEATEEENEENDEDQDDSTVEIKQTINPIFNEISYLDDFQDFLKTQIEKINEEKEDYDSFSFDQHFIHNHYKVEKCNLDTCPITKGFCSNLHKNKCICNTHTLNFFPTTDPYNMKVNRKFRKDLCSYKQKKIISAMVLEILIPFGLGHLYAQRYLFALLKFVSFFMIPLFILLIFGIDLIENLKKNLKKFRRDFNYPKIEEDKKFEYMEYFKTGIITLQLGSFFISYMLDAFFFGLGIYKDGYGFDLV